MKNLLLRRRALILGLVSLAVWLVANPPLRFGVATFFGFTTYSTVPIPYYDVTIHVGGLFSLREKSHLITVGEVGALTNEGASVIVIGIGYERAAQVEAEALQGAQAKGIAVEVYATPEAFGRFNELASRGVKVVAIIHTSC